MKTGTATYVQNECTRDRNSVNPLPLSIFDLESRYSILPENCEALDVIQVGLRIGRGPVPNYNEKEKDSILLHN